MRDFESLVKQLKNSVQSQEAILLTDVVSMLSYEERTRIRDMDT